MFRPRWLWIVAVLVTVSLLMLGRYVWKTPPGVASGPTTRLEIEITGGFAYVPTTADNHLEIAYLNSVDMKEDIDTDGDGVIDQPNKSVCNVQQIGTELKVTRGSITTSQPMAAPASNEFNLDQAVVTFPALEGANQTLQLARGPWPPTGSSAPANPDVEGDWNDLKWVPKLTDHHNSSTLNPNWRTMVNGRVVLRGGQLRATFPSNPILKRAKFDFKDSTGSRFSTAATDKMIYTVDVPGTEIEMLLSDATSGYERIVIKPQGNLVRLTLKGLHSMSAQPSLANGAPLTDFCTFYQLMQPVPKAKDFLVPHYLASTTAGQTGPGGAAPSPGFFCMGDGF